MTFSPLFVGEMVVTNSACGCICSWVYFQSPIRRGNGCNNMTARQVGANFILSVPYSSGKWL